MKQLKKLITLLTSFNANFWVIITSKFFERCAWYGLYSLIALFLVGPTDQGALGLTYVQKGAILGVVPFFVYFFPLLSGTIADKYGYKKMLQISFAVLSIGYYSLSYASGYYTVFVFFMLIALGVGIFKPLATGTTALITRGDKIKASLGFSILFVAVNLGGFVGPIISGVFRPTVGKDGSISGSWNYVFYLSAGYMVAMFMFVLVFFQESEKHTKNVGDSFTARLKEVITDLKDVRLLTLLLVFVGFWAMFQQFFITLPNWIIEWVDTSMLAEWIPFETWKSYDQLKPEFIIIFNFLSIVFLNVVIAVTVDRYNILNTISFGIMISAISIAGLILASPQIGGAYAHWILLVMIFVFTLGEMMSVPKFSELMGQIAPAEKIGTYQAYGFLSVALGNLLGGVLTGLYGTFADKKLMYADKLGLGEDALKQKSIHELGAMLQAQGIDLEKLDQQLWTNHHPWIIWIIYGCFGFATFIALRVYLIYIPNIDERDKM